MITSVISQHNARAVVLSLPYNVQLPALFTLAVTGTEAH
jgi:hypothetical protein